MMREKERRDNVTILFHTCASKQHHVLHDRVSYFVTFIYYQWEFFIIEVFLYIPTMGFPKLPQVFMSKRVGCTPTQFSFELSYTYSSSASVALQSLLLALTSIDLHSLLICLVNLKCSPFLSSPQPPLYSTYSAMSMAHAHVLRES